MTEEDQALGRIYHTEVAAEKPQAVASTTPQDADDYMEVSVQDLDSPTPSQKVSAAPSGHNVQAGASWWLTVLTFLIILVPTVIVWLLVIQRGL